MTNATEMSTDLTVAEPTHASGLQSYLPPVDLQAVEQAMMIGDLSQMTPPVRLAYYVATCQSLGLNPLTRPFQALKNDDGEVRLYPDKGCAEQLRKRDRISIRTISREYVDDLYIVTVEARTPDGRTEEAEGAVPVMEVAGAWEEGTKRNGEKYRFKRELLGSDGQPILKRLTGTAMSQARMRCETKAKRRATLAICGLGLTDEGAHPMRLNLQSGALDGGVDFVAPLREETATPSHIADLYGPSSADLQQAHASASRPLREEWAQMAQWYADAGREEKYAEFVQWACRQHRAQVIQDIPQAEVAALAAHVYEQLAPLMVEAQARRDSPLVNEGDTGDATDADE